MTLMASASAAASRAVIEHGSGWLTAKLAGVRQRGIGNSGDPNVRFSGKTGSDTDIVKLTRLHSHLPLYRNHSVRYSRYRPGLPSAGDRRNRERHASSTAAAAARGGRAGRAVTHAHIRAS